MRRKILMIVKQTKERGQVKNQVKKKVKRKSLYLFLIKEIKCRSE